MFKSQFKLRVTLQAPRDSVFGVLTNHALMGDWPGISRAALIRKGTSSPNGLGAVRRIWVRGLVLDELITDWSPPESFEYEIIKGLPVDHLGKVRLSDESGATVVEWSIRMSSPIPLLAPVILSQLKRGLGDALSYVETQAAVSA